MADPRPTPTEAAYVEDRAAEADEDELIAFYRHLAESEFDGYCPLYAELARGIAADPAPVAPVRIYQTDAYGRIRADQPSWQVLADGRIVEADIDLAVDAAGEIRLGGEILARIDGTRMSFVGESATFEIVPGALQIATAGEVEERLDLEGNPPPRTALLLAVLLMFANGAAGP